MDFVRTTQECSMWAKLNFADLKWLYEDCRVISSYHSAGDSFTSSDESCPVAALRRTT